MLGRDARAVVGDLDEAPSCSAITVDPEPTRGGRIGQRLLGIDQEVQDDLVSRS